MKEKEEYWLTCIQHFLENHQKYPTKLHSDVKPLKNSSSKEFIYHLANYLSETFPLIKKCHIEYSTNKNESFNYQKACYAPKMFTYKGSYSGRIWCTILQRNFPHKWVLEIRRLLRLSFLHWNHIYLRKNKWDWIIFRLNTKKNKENWNKDGDKTT